MLIYYIWIEWNLPNCRGNWVYLIGGEKIAWGIDCATEKTTQIVSNHLTKYQSSLKSIDEPVVISPALRTSVYYVHRGSKIIAKCTRFLRKFFLHFHLKNRNPI